MTHDSIKFPFSPCSNPGQCHDDSLSETPHAAVSCADQGQINFERAGCSFFSSASYPSILTSFLRRCYRHSWRCGQPPPRLCQLFSGALCAHFHPPAPWSHQQAWHPFPSEECRLPAMPPNDSLRPQHPSPPSVRMSKAITHLQYDTSNFFFNASIFASATLLHQRS